MIGSGTFEELSPLVAKVSASLKHLDEKAEYLTKRSTAFDVHDSNKCTRSILEHPDKNYTKATISETTVANELQNDAEPMHVCLKMLCNNDCS